MDLTWDLHRDYKQAIMAIKVLMVPGFSFTIELRTGWKVAAIAATINSALSFQTCLPVLQGHHWMCL